MGADNLGLVGVRAHPSRWGVQALVHPVTVTCMAVLLINDRVLKSQWPGWLTGKLSDVAGLAFFPLLLATVVGVLRRSPRWTIAASVVVTGMWFAALKTVPAVTGATTDLVTLVSGHPARIVVDPSDLLALPAMTWAVRAWRPPPIRTTLTAPRLAVLLGAALLSLGTSYMCYDGPRDLTVRDPTVIAHGGSPTVMSTDTGVTWTTPHPGAKVPLATGTTTTACLPGRPERCFRVDGPRILASTDGGATWRIDWTYPVERDAFTARLSDGSCGEYLVEGTDVVVLDGPEPVVLAAMSDHGVVRRGTDGAWSVVDLGIPQVGVPTSATGSHIGGELVIAVAIAVLLTIVLSWEAAWRLARHHLVANALPGRRRVRALRIVGGGVAAAVIVFVASTAFSEPGGIGTALFYLSPLLVMAAALGVGALVSVDARWRALADAASDRELIHQVNRLTVRTAWTAAGAVVSVALAWSAGIIARLGTAYVMIAIAVAAACVVSRQMTARVIAAALATEEDTAAAEEPDAQGASGTPRPRSGQ